MANVQFEVPAPPSDGVSSLQFAESADHLLASSWDHTARVYDASGQDCLSVVDPCGSPLLTSQWAGQFQCLSGAINGTITLTDLNTSQTLQALQSHKAGVSKIVSPGYWSSPSLCASGSWDMFLHVYDIRSGEQPVIQQFLHSKIYAMAAVPSSHLLLVGTADRRIHIYDTRNMATAEQVRESSLRHQTRGLAAMIDGSGYCLSSIEGRVAVEYIDPSPQVQQGKYAFKCHRGVTADGKNLVYPVNCIAFHPKYGTFATGGDDQIVSIWDGIARKRIRQLAPYPTSISALAFSSDGNYLAVASSYTFSEGDKEHPYDQIFIRVVDRSDVTPKVAVKRDRQ